MTCESPFLYNSKGNLLLNKLFSLSGNINFKEYKTPKIFSEFVFCEEYSPPTILCEETQLWPDLNIKSNIDISINFISPQEYVINTEDPIYKFEFLNIVITNITINTHVNNTKLEPFTISDIPFSIDNNGNFNNIINIPNFSLKFGNINLYNTQNVLNFCVKSQENKTWIFMKSLVTIQNDNFNTSIELTSNLDNVTN
jgi:hypothetical protein